MVRAQALPPVRLLALRGFAAHQLARMLHSLVRVSRRADGKPSASIARTQFPKDSVERPLLPRASGRQGRRIERRACPARPLDADQRPAHAAGRVGRREPGRTRDFPSLPPQQFQVLFNSLFKVLFIFPSRYLFAIGLPPVFSLRWDLPPDLGCIPKQPDSAKAPRGAAGRAPTGFSPSPTLPSSRLGRCPPQRTPLQTTIRRPRAGDFHDGLFPLRSPLLGESWLVSSPPPTDMLKLSGWSCLNSGRT